MMRRFIHQPLVLSCGFLTIGMLGISIAQEPAVNSLTPGAITPGAVNTLQVNGGNLAVAKKLWTSFSCESSLADGIEKNGENPGQATFKVTVPADTPCGVHAMRVVTDKGVTPLRFLFS